MNVGSWTPFNMSAHTDTQQKVAAPRQSLRTSGLQR